MAALATTHTEFPAVVRDVSTGGVLVETNASLPAGLQCQLTFTAFGKEYTAGLEVVRHLQGGEARLYGCRLLLPEYAAGQLEQAVRAVLGEAATQVRAWEDISEEVRHPANGSTVVVVGHTPSGKAIELSPADCLEMGPEGIELFVRTVGEVETM